MRPTTLSAQTAKPDSRDVWRIALPMIVSNVSVPLLGMVDTGVAGHLGDAVYLGAVAIGSAVFGFLFTGMNFLRMGTTGIAAQRFGAADYDGIRTALGQALVVALIVSSALLLFKKPVIDLALGFMGADLAVGHHAETYLAIRMWSAPATLSSYALIGWFIGMQNARAPLIMVLVTNSINILLDLWFVIGLGMQVDGVAAASVIAEYSGIFVAIFLIRPLLRQHPGRWQPERLSRLREYRAFLGINANLFVRTIALVGTFTFVTAQGARLGGLVLAANAILMNFQNLLAFALDGLAHAAEALVGKATGAGDRASLLRSVMLTRRWSASIALAFSALFYAGGPALIGLLTDLPDVRQATLEYLPWMVLSPVISVWPFLYDGVFVGATRASEMRNSMLFSALAVFIPAWYVLQPWGNHGLWLAFLIFMAARAASMHYLYNRRIARE